VFLNLKTGPQHRDSKLILVLEEGC
jgi:hypothetical protein